jgi:hypothetical protein
MYSKLLPFMRFFFIPGTVRFFIQGYGMLGNSRSLRRAAYIQLIVIASQQDGIEE